MFSNPWDTTANESEVKFFKFDTHFQITNTSELDQILNGNFVKKFNSIVVKL